MTLTRYLEWQKPLMADYGGFINLIRWHASNRIAAAYEGDGAFEKGGLPTERAESGNPGSILLSHARGEGKGRTAKGLSNQSGLSGGTRSGRSTQGNSPQDDSESPTGYRNIALDIIAYSALIGTSICLLIVFILIWVDGRYWVYENNLLIRAFETFLFTALIGFGIGMIVRKIKGGYGKSRRLRENKHHRYNREGYWDSEPET